MSQVKNNMGLLPDGFDKKNIKDNYFLRFKYCFKDEDDGKTCWPADLQEVASQFGKIASTLFADLFLNANTMEKAHGIVSYGVFLYKGMYNRLKEVNGLKIGDGYSQDIINKLTTTAESNSKTRSHKKADMSGNNKSQDFDNNNDEVKDGDDASVGNTSQYIDGSTNTDATSNTKEQADAKLEGSYKGEESTERKNIQYNAADMLKLLKVAIDPNTYLFSKLITYISAPVQIDQEVLHEGQGDFE